MSYYEDEYIFANHSLGGADDETVYLGWLIIDLKRHIADLAEMCDDEGRALGLFLARLSRALQAATNAEHIYAMLSGDGVPHVHFHLVPRYPGTPAEYRGMNVQNWAKAPRGGDSEIITVCAKIRQQLQVESE